MQFYIKCYSFLTLVPAMHSLRSVQKAVGSIETITFWNFCTLHFGHFKRDKSYFLALRSIIFKKISPESEF